MTLSATLKDKLLATDPESWTTFVEMFAEGEPDLPIDAEFAKELIAETGVGPVEDNARQYFEQSEKFFTTMTGMRRFRDWLYAGVLEGTTASDPETWAVRFLKLRSNPGEDGGYAEALELYQAMKVGDAKDVTLGAMAQLVVRGTYVTRDYTESLKYAQAASQHYIDAKDAAGASNASRKLGVALLYNGQVQAAFKVFASALQSRGPMFGGGGTTIYTKAPNEREEAIDEIQAIAEWADAKTPEWVRAVGGLAERWPEEADYLWPVYEQYVTMLFEETHNPESDIEVIVRQSGQRGLMETPARAIDIYLEFFPEDDWAWDQKKFIGEFRRVEDLIALKDSDFEKMVEGLTEILNEMRDKGELGERNLSFQVIDALVDGLVEAKDARALDVQKDIWEYKLDKYGECPAAWLEEQNYGTILIQFDRPDEARTHIQNALDKLKNQFGPEHPHVQMARRNLDRLNS